MWDLLTENWKLLLPLGTGALALLALLPQPRRLPPIVGLGLLLVTFVLAFYGIGSVAGVEQGLFFAFSLIAVVSGFLLVTQTQPARAALSFTLVVLATCGLFLLLAAPFLFAATIIVYAGAIIVTFLFVLMLAQQTGRDDADLRSREPLFSVVTGLILLGTLFFLIQKDVATQTAGEQDPPQLVSVPQLQRLTALAGRAAEAPKPEQLKALFDSATIQEGDDTIILPQLLRAQFATFAAEGRFGKAQFASLSRQMEEVINDWQTLGKEVNSSTTEARRALLRKMHTAGSEALALFPLRAVSPLSNLSGPVGVPANEIRRGSDGRPAMPAENATHLGKSLFTDFLLPVELGGVLLLVAVVGAIIIAQRQDEQGKEIA